MIELFLLVAMIVGIVVIVRAWWLCRAIHSTSGPCRRLRWHRGNHVSGPVLWRYVKPWQIGEQGCRARGGVWLG